MVSGSSGVHVLEGKSAEPTEVVLSTAGEAKRSVFGLKSYFTNVSVPAYPDMSPHPSLLNLFLPAPYSMHPTPVISASSLLPASLFIVQVLITFHLSY